MEKVYDFKFYDEVHKIVLGKTSYRNNETLAIVMIEVFDDGHEEDFGVLTVNLDTGGVNLANSEDSQFIDTNNLHDDIGKWLRDNDIASPTGLYWPSGFCVYPLYHFNKQSLKEMRTL